MATFNKSSLEIKRIKEIFHSFAIVINMFRIAVKNQWIEGYIFALTENKYSYSIIHKRCNMHGVKVSNAK